MVEPTARGQETETRPVAEGTRKGRPETVKTNWNILLVLALTLGTCALGENPGSVEGGLEVPGTPTLTPSTPAPPTQDRAKSSAAAVAMAMAAASQQKISCFMMMSEAQKEEDKSTKAMMMMMAQQMCAQADQTMANAMKNKEGQKLVSANDIPKQATLKAGQAKFGKNKVTEADVPRITYLGENGEEDNGKDPYEDLVAPLPEPNLAVFDPPPGEDEIPPPVDQVVNPPEDIFGQLDPIDGAAVKFDDAPKNNEDNNNLGARAAFIGGSAQAPDGEDGKAKSTETGDGGELDRRGRRGVRTASGGEGDSSGSSESGSKKNYAALLQQMLGGGGKDPRSGLTSGAGGDIVDLPRKKGEDDLPNLFEYASFRYRKLAYEKGQVKLKRITQVRLPRTSTIAKASKTFTRPVKKLDSSHGK